MANPRILTPDTLVPLSISATLATAVWIIANISSVAHSNTQRINELEMRSYQQDKRVYERMNRIDHDLGDIKARLGLQSGKLDILIEMEARKSKG